MNNTHKKQITILEYMEGIIVQYTKEFIEVKVNRINERTVNPFRAVIRREISNEELPSGSYFIARDQNNSSLLFCPLEYIN